MTLLQNGLAAATLYELVVQLLGLGLAAATAAGLAALAYRWYVRERVPSGLAILLGLSVVVVVYIGTTGALGAVIAGDDSVLDSRFVLRNLAAFAVGAGASSVGRRVGDAVGTDLFAAAGGKQVDRDVSEIVQTVGRVTSVRLPEEIDDIVGYDPMPEATRETLAGRRFIFPRRLTKADLRERIVARLKTDYGVGHVDIELTDDGEVSYLAIGSRAAGIGPTLPPATNAVAIHADPANAASAGDLVQVWETEPLSRVLTGELRGVVDDVVTVAIDAADTPKLDPDERYRLVTLPVQDRPDREFASLLRAAEETMGTVTVTAGSELDGATVGELAVTVAAITREDAPPAPIPPRDRVLDAGDVVYAIARPEALRHVEEAATRQRAEPAVDTAGEAPADSESETAPVDDGPVSEETADEPTDEGVAGDDEATAAPDTADTASGEPPAEPSDDELLGDPPDEEPASGDGEPPADGEPAATEPPEPAEPSRGDEEVTIWDPEERLAAANESDGAATDEAGQDEVATADESDGDATADESPAESTATGEDSDDDAVSDDERT